MPSLKDAKHLYWIAALVVALGAGAWWYSTAHEAVPGIPPERYDEAEPEEPEDPTTERACMEAGGFWNACASACPDAGPDEVCIEVCVERCEGLGTELERPVFLFNPMFSSRENPECDEVYPAMRALARTSGTVEWPEVALRSLLAGTTAEEEAAGFSTNIPEDVALVSFEIEDGTAFADFSSEMNAAAGSCRVLAIRAQIERTLQQFAEVGEVVISVEGNVEEALQP